MVWLRGTTTCRCFCRSCALPHHSYCSLSSLQLILTFSITISLPLVVLREDVIYTRARLLDDGDGACSGGRFKLSKHLAASRQLDGIGLAEDTTDSSSTQIVVIMLVIQHIKPAASLVLERKACKIFKKNICSHVYRWPATALQ